MRLFHVIFSLYFLFLSSFSCTDELTVQKSEGNMAQIEADQPSNQHEDETCSPLCICSCCGSMAVHFSMRINDISQPLVFNKYMATEEKSVIDISLSVWQPPKLI